MDNLNLLNHNFADKELTLLLPKKELVERNNDVYVYTEPYYEYRVKWTWEDIRLYLKKKGFIINIDYWGPNYKNYFAEKAYSITVVLNGIPVNLQNLSRPTEYFDTYEEARREAIIYCLNLIKEENEKTN